MERVSPGASLREVIFGSPRAFPREFTDGQRRGTAVTAKALNCSFFLFSPVFSCSHREGGAAVVSAWHGGELAGAWGCGQGTGAGGTWPPHWPGRAGTCRRCGQVHPHWGAGAASWRGDQKIEGFSLHTLCKGWVLVALPSPYEQPKSVGTWGLSSW